MSRFAAFVAISLGSLAFGCQELSPIVCPNEFSPAETEWHASSETNITLFSTIELHLTFTNNTGSELLVNQFSAHTLPGLESIPIVGMPMLPLAPVAADAQFTVGAILDVSTLTMGDRNFAFTLGNGSNVGPAQVTLRNVNSVQCVQ